MELSISSILVDMFLFGLCAYSFLQSLTLLKKNLSRIWRIMDLEWKNRNAAYYFILLREKYESKMTKVKKHIYKKWEVSIVELKSNGTKKFKVTRRIPELSVAETKFFRTKEEAKKQFDEWLK